ncbi:MAG: transcriptional regulator [Myxococcales bacterium]|nr:transcriptional regulator [Myxococcales bacterium]MCC6524279.1 transcriptional regulator [Polyangiaceae bacterium]
MPPRAYRSFAEFERDYIRPAMKVGQSVEEMIDDGPFDQEFSLDDIDADPFDAQDDKY